MLVRIEHVLVLVEPSLKLIRAGGPRAGLEFGGAERASKRGGELAAPVEVGPQQGYRSCPTALAGCNHAVSVVIDAQVVELFIALGRVVWKGYRVGVEQAEHEQEDRAAHRTQKLNKLMVRHRVSALTFC